MQDKESLQESPTNAEQAASRSRRPKPPAASGSRKLLPNLALAALLGILLLTLLFWLGGFPFPFLQAPADLPTLSLLSSGPYTTGSSMRLHGEKFSRYSIVALLRDGQPAMDSNGLRLAVNADSQGTFTTILPITSAWGIGNHIIAAEDTTNHQSATLVVVVESTSDLIKSP